MPEISALIPLVVSPFSRRRPAEFGSRSYDPPALAFSIGLPTCGNLRSTNCFSPGDVPLILPVTSYFLEVVPLPDPCCLFLPGIAPGLLSDERQSTPFDYRFLFFFTDRAVLSPPSAAKANMSLRPFPIIHFPLLSFAHPELTLVLRNVPFSSKEQDLS